MSNALTIAHLLLPRLLPGDLLEIARRGDKVIIEFHTGSGRVQVHELLDDDERLIMWRDSDTDAWVEFVERMKVVPVNDNDSAEDPAQDPAEDPAQDPAAGLPETSAADIFFGIDYAAHDVDPDDDDDRAGPGRLVPRMPSAAGVALDETAADDTNPEKPAD